MKRQKQKTKPRKKVTAPAQEAVKPANRKLSRRHFLGNSAIYSAGLAVLGGGGWYFASTISAEARECDLSAIGNGIPAVVQVHDPSCPTCNQLRREARAAASSFDDGQLRFLIANLQTEEGRALAAAHGVGKITLLLFDGQGNKTATLPGLKTAENLKPVFARHIRRYGQKPPSS